MRTAAQIAKLMREVREAIQRKVERLRLKEEERKDQREEDAIFYTGKCGYCGKEVGEKMRWCNRNCRRRARPASLPSGACSLDRRECLT